MDIDDPNYAAALARRVRKEVGADSCIILLGWADSGAGRVLCSTEADPVRIVEEALTGMKAGVFRPAQRSDN